MGAVPEIDVHRAHARLEAGHALLIDVREVEEFTAGHAPGAVSLPLGALTAEQVPDGVDLLLVCRSGGRSARAVQLLGAAGRHAANVAGGMRAWQAAGLDLVADGGRPATVA